MVSLLELQRVHRDAGRAGGKLVAAAAIYEMPDGSLQTTTLFGNDAKDHEVLQRAAVLSRQCSLQVLGVASRQFAGIPGKA